MINVITLFSGYDSQCLALNRLGVEYDLVAWCEIDKYAIKAHDALFPQWSDRNLGDISQVDWSAVKEPIDLLTYSSPCQDFSSAGLQKGGDEGSGTRSGLLWEVEKAIKTLRPKYLVFENVPALVSDKFIGVFNKWQARLNEYGYTNFQQLMNAKNYGVPQNRVRIFMLSIRDCDRQYHFPKPFKLEKRLKDVLEQNVDERYYLSEKAISGLLRFNQEREEKRQGFRWEPKQGNDIGAAVLTTAGSRPCDNYIVEPQPLLIPQATKEGYAVVPEGGVFDASYPDSTTRRGRIQEGGTVSPTIMASQNELLRYEGMSDRQASIKAKVMPNGDIRCYRDIPSKPGVSELQFTHPNNEAPTVTCEAQIKVIEGPLNTCQGGQREPKIIEDFYGTVRDPRVYTDEAPTLRADRTGLMATEGIRIRRLTERELYRLMDVDEKDIDTLLSAPIPRTQHAKLAGNSIVVSCLYHIFRNLFVDTEPQVGTQTKLF